MKISILRLQLAPLIAAVAFLFTTPFALSVERGAAVIASVESHNAHALEREAKKKAMRESGFAFYRATAHLYYEDIQSGLLPIPKEWTDNTPPTWLSGDFHFQNVGLEDPADKKEMRLDLNDFDESVVGPFQWDLIRFVTSLYVAVQPPGEVWTDTSPFIKNLTIDKVPGVANAFLETYDQALVSAKPQALTRANLGDTGVKIDGDFLDKKLKKLEDEAKRAEETEKFWSGLNGSAGVRLVTSGNDKLQAVKPEFKITPDDLTAYAKTLAGDRGLLGGDDLAELEEAERLNSGLGSLGVLKVYVLLRRKQPGDKLTEGKDYVLLEFKESLRAAPVEAGLAVGAAGDLPPGQRVSAAARALAAHADPYDGWLEKGGKSFHVSRISPLGTSFKPKNLDKLDDFKNFVAWSAVALANSHRRAAEKLGKGNFAKEANKALDEKMRQQIVKLGETYALQVKQDWEAFSKAGGN